MDIVSSILTILLSGLTTTAQKMGAGINEFFTNLFVSEGVLTVFANVTLAFMGVALALGLCYAILNFVTTMGKGRL